MKSSKFIKVDNNVLIEYQYNSNNNISENYVILNNRKTAQKQFMSTITDYKNVLDNQLFNIDVLSNKYLKIDSDKYPYLELNNYAASTFIRYDLIKIYLPSNYVFDEFKGFKLSIYTKDYYNEQDIYLSNYFYDISDSNRTFEMDFENPPMLYNEKLWGKSITIQVPSTAFVALQREDNKPKPNSINYNLTTDGLSISSPIFIDFAFITKIDTVNSIKNYYINGETTISYPQSAEYESIGINIIPSTNGDYYEIFGIYNGSQSDFVKYINDSIYLGYRYVLEYSVTIFEENLKGKTYTFLIDENFDDVIEYRPIIKFSTTTAIINVEMRLIDKVTDSQILKRASYGMLPNEVSKYSLHLMKINISDANSIKIYNTKNSTLSNTALGSILPNTTLNVEVVKVPYPIFYDKSAAVAKSESVEANGLSWLSNGQMRLVIMPFDNYIKIILAEKISTTNNNTVINYFNLNLNDNINLVFKNNSIEVKCPLQKNSTEVDLTKGFLVFKISQKDINNIRSIYTSNINTFYITTTSTSTGDTTAIYAGLFIMFDNANNIVNLNITKDNEVKSYIIQGDTQIDKAIVTDVNNLTNKNATGL